MTPTHRIGIGDAERIGRRAATPAPDTVTATETHCPYCALQCGMRLVVRNGAVSVAVRDFPTNKGGLCQKGWSAAELLSRLDRLTAPLMRTAKGEPLRPVSWDAALDRTAAEIRRVQDRHGREAIGVFGGGGLTNEKAYLLGKFARVGLQTPNIDYNGRFCMSSAASASLRAFGIDRGLPFPLEDIPRAEVILLVGANPAETMPPIMQYFEAQKRSGGSLIVVDPRRTPTARSSTLHLQLTPGTDMAVAIGLLHIALRDSLVDCDFIADRTRGFDAVRRDAASFWPDRVERLTGVPAAVLEQAARLLGRAKSAMILTARGPEQQAKGVDNTLAFINLALALGMIGKPGSGWGCLTGQGNGQGAREHGQKADQLPGYRRIDNAADREHVAGVWGIQSDELPGPGMSAYEMLDSLGSPADAPRSAGSDRTRASVRALLVIGSNPAVSAPNSAHVRERLKSLEFLAVSDLFLSETAELADVVFPSAQWAEEEGTMTNLEGRVLLRRRAAQPPEGVRSDLELLAALARRLGRGRYFTDDPESVFDELRRASAGGAADYSGITWRRIEAEDGVFWPCPDAGEHGQEHPGSPRLFERRFATEDGRARFCAVRYRPSAEEPDAEFPLYLTTGRVMAQYQSGTQTRRVKALNAIAPEPRLEIHPELARRLAIEDGRRVRIATRRGEAVMTARLTATIRPDTLFAPFHWPGVGSANLLTNPALDPVSRMPEFKVCAARIIPDGTEPATSQGLENGGAAAIPDVCRRTEAIPGPQGES
ncbi:MAG TPA: molybdopterin oxidoreductase family protein [Chthonomonadaceae bacterium]|nr:molybdopterin oxidoreductase family protein [Chthonomonadaceae bacterium]